MMPVGCVFHYCSIKERGELRRSKPPDLSENEGIEASKTKGPTLNCDGWGGTDQDVETVQIPSPQVIKLTGKGWESSLSRKTTSIFLSVTMFWGGKAVTRAGMTEKRGARRTSELSGGNPVKRSPTPIPVSKED